MSGESSDTAIRSAYLSDELDELIGTPDRSFGIIQERKFFAPKPPAQVEEQKGDKEVGISLVRASSLCFFRAEGEEMQALEQVLETCD